MIKNIYETKGDQVLDILTAGMNSVYSEEMNDPMADEMLFELKNEFIRKLYEFETRLEEYKKDVAYTEEIKDNVKNIINPLTF